ncbi:hypothetical protein [Actinoplanes subglobosus]|uniref:Uncharacterized protein n=1 Tax=Actinoplanes subglobosus TaxID=1547892 RepID=A0ABV8JA07_9ACTN
MGFRFPEAFLGALIESGRGRRVTVRCQTCDRYTEQLTLPEPGPGSPLVDLPMMAMFTSGYSSICLGCRTLHRQTEPFDD